ncbi:MAG: SLAC1 anion channel family protein [Alphaproteobacteria bacterium]
MTQVNTIKSFPDVPVSAFAAVLGIAGLGIAWRNAAPGLGVTPVIGEVLIFAGALLFAWISAAYGMKIIRSPQAMRAEFDDLKRIPFAAAVPLSLQLFAAGAVPLDTAIATLLWVAGTVFQIILLLIILSRLMSGGHARRNLRPSIFLPAAGLLLGPGTACQLGYSEIGWMMFSMGVLMWLMFLVMLFDRLIFEMPLDDDELPLLAITVTPPALAFVSYTELNQQMVDSFARILFYAMVFFLILTLAHALRFMRLRFSLAWWSFTFPASAAAGAALEYRMAAGTNFPAGLSAALLGLASLLAAYCAVRTVLGLRSGNLLKRIS